MESNDKVDDVAFGNMQPEGKDQVSDDELETKASQDGDKVNDPTQGEGYFPNLHPASTVQSEVESKVEEDPGQAAAAAEVVQNSEGGKNNAEETLGRGARKKTLTDKGKAEKLRLLKNKQTSLLSAITKKKNELLKLIQSDNCDNLHLVKLTYVEYNELCSQYHAHFEVVFSQLTFEVDQVRELERYEDRQVAFDEFRVYVESWVEKSERMLGDQIESASNGSKVSKSSSARSTRSALARERARLAELHAQKSMQDAIMEHQKKTEELRLDMKIAKAKAREMVYAEFESTSMANIQVGNPIGKLPVDIKHEYVLKSLTNCNLSSQDADRKPPYLPQDDWTSHQPPAINVTSYQPSVRVTSYQPSARVTSDHPPIVNVPSYLPRAARTSHLPPTIMMTKTNLQGANVSTSYLPSATVTSYPPPTANLTTDPPPGANVSNSCLQSTAYINMPYLPPAANLTSEMHAAPIMTSYLPSTASTSMPAFQQYPPSGLFVPPVTPSPTSLPQPEVPKFKGDPTDYITFMMAFDARIVPNTTNDVDRLYYLDQLLIGECKDLISGCLYMEPSEGYRSARHLLKKHYGDPYRISNAYVNQVLSWPSLKYDDPKLLKRFSFFLIKCSHAMRTMSHMAVLNHTPNLKAVVSKLPMYLQNRWRDQVITLRLKGREVTFKDVVDFVQFAAESANEPVFSREEPQKSATTSRTPVQPRSGRQKSTSFATNVTSPRTLSCYYCHKNHDLDDCSDFLQKSLEDRKTFLKEKRMCFGCYGSSHIAKGCSRKRQCKQCGRRHPTAMHDDNYMPSAKNTSAKESQRDAASANTVSASCNTSFDKGELVLQAVLPVLVHQKGKDTSIKTYALLDNGSTGCFVTDNLAEEIKASSTASLLKLKTMHGVQTVNTCSVSNLIVTSLDGQNKICLPKCFTREEIPVSHTQIPNANVLKQFPHLKQVAEVLPDFSPSTDVGLLIGSNCPVALQPQRIVPTDGKGPFAVLYQLGWTVSGPVHVQFNQGDNNLTCNTASFHEVTRVTECPTPDRILKMFQLDFSEKDQGKVPGDKGNSREDERFLSIAKDNMKIVDGHFELPLPLKDMAQTANREQAVKRAKWQKKKMMDNDQYYKDYCAFMDNLLSHNYAYKIPSNEIHASPDQIWYLPHHGVYHPKKPQKIRVVFDASATFNGSSLNDRLLQGPDLTNSLIGVLTRFRTEPVAFMGDIEAMFYQVKVPIEQHDQLRFLWWPDGNLKSELEEYRMSVHIFGAISSPSISNFALKATADKAEDRYGTEVADTIRRNFYVDDWLKSAENDDKAIKLVKDVQAACEEGGFRLTKFVSNSKNVLKSIPEVDRAKQIQTCDLDYDEIPIDRALGLQWHVSSDMFGFSTDLPSKPVTRRGILSTVSSLYDPLGMVSPVILPAKKILQDLCVDKTLGWDDNIPSELNHRWEDWLNHLPQLGELRIPRCVRPVDFGSIVSRQLHLFSDASSLGYGCAAYLRLLDENKNIHVSFLMGKSRLAPVKIVTIPRLELTAASVSLQLGQQLLNQLDMKIDTVSYYTDSSTVLHYINNETKRFPIFVANRVRLIRDYSYPSQWKFINSNSNPADMASRGLRVEQLLHASTWFNGPNFLHDHESEWPSCSIPNIPMETVTTMDLQTEVTGCMDKLISHYSTWYRLKRAVAVFITLRDLLYSRIKEDEHLMLTDHPFSVEKLEEAERTVIKYVQREAFPVESESLSDVSGKRGRVLKSSSIYKLDPYIEDGILRLGGRLGRADIHTDMMHQILLPSKSHVTKLIIQDIHVRLGHSGRNHVLSILREKYWVIKANARVRNVLSQCVTCRRMKAPVCNQKMADLPACRVNPSPPFTHTGIDFFGPHVVKEGRKYAKRYGALFTCLACRAIHVETTVSLDTDSFILALRRFIARRGPIKEILCDNGTNFVGAERELREAVMEMDQDRVTEYLLKQEIKWKFNPPAASHMGGSWERMIGSVRKVLSPLLKEFGDRIDDESYRTLLCEVEAIVNSRPLTTVSDDPNDLNPITPSHFLMPKSDVYFPPPGQFQRHDVYMRRRWRRVQYLASLFWTRWRKEYLPTLQERQKWTVPKRNLQIGDVVLIKDENLHRSEWAMGRVVSCESGKSGLVRSVEVKTQKGQLRRPIHKLVLLLAKSE